MIKQQLKMSKRVVCGIGFKNKVEFGGPYTKHQNMNLKHDEYKTVNWKKNYK